VTLDPVFMPLRELAGHVRARRVSPVELAETFLARLEKIGPRYNAVVTVTRERALAEARRAEEEIVAGRYRGPLHGIPYGAKDLLATGGGVPTTWGAEPFRGQRLAEDATVIRRLSAAGAVLCAKLAMIELAGGMGYRQPNASFTGPVSTPWSRDAWSGGSSSGSGAAVSAGLVPFAIGSETWGSILSPSGNCGITGLRPTYGRVSRHGAMALCWTLDKLGPMALTADDCGLVLEAIAGVDPADPTTSPRPYRYAAEDGPRRFRFGVLAGALDGVSEDMLAAYRRSLDVLRELGTVEDTALPDLPWEAAIRIILQAEAASAFDEFIESGGVAELTAPEDHFMPYARDAVLAKDYVKATRVRGVMAREADRLFERFDVLVAPGRLTVATPLGQEFRGGMRGTARDIMGAVGNGAGLPGLIVPNGFGERGLPTSLQLMGRAWEENTLLAVGRAVQARTDWHTKHPLVER
jgi:Asp-tRNA(Asn)/Glu-tRNA(Gln) amidotransferase A subunit family amidase